MRVNAKGMLRLIFSNIVKIGFCNAIDRESSAWIDWSNIYIRFSFIFLSVIAGHLKDNFYIHINGNKGTWEDDLFFFLFYPLVLLKPISSLLT